MCQIILVASRADPATRALERELQNIGVGYRVERYGDRPEFQSIYGIRRVPCLLINDRIAYHGPLSAPDLRLILSAFTPTAAERAHRALSPESPRAIA